MKKTNLTAICCKRFAALAIILFINSKIFAAFPCGIENFGSGYGTNVTYASQLPNNNYSGVIGISGTFYIDVANFTFLNADIYMDVAASIIVNDYVQFDLYSSTVQSCNGADMWHTIVGIGSNSFINVDNSVIQDGEIAIALENSAAFSVVNSTFNRNSTSINVWGGTYTSASAFVDKCHFYCEYPIGSGIPANLLMPLNNQKSYAAINMLNAYGVVINGGNPTGEVTNHQFGINSNVSNFYLYDFDIADCDYGVWIKNNGTVGATTIIANSFTNCPVGVLVLNADQTALMVNGNRFLETPICIDIYQVIDATINVNGNIINYSGWTPLPFVSYAYPDYTTNGIRITNYVKARASACLVNNNYINNTQFGIHIKNVDRVSANLNFIDFLIPFDDLLPFGREHIGIHLEDCSQASASNNEINRPQVDCRCDFNLEDRLMRAIKFTQSNTSNTIADNSSIAFMSNAIYFKNSCFGTQVKCNKFIESYSGVSIGKAAESVTATISDQIWGAHKDEWTTNWIFDPTRRVTEKNPFIIDWEYAGSAGTGNSEFPDGSWTPNPSVKTVIEVSVPNSLSCQVAESESFNEEIRARLLGRIVNNEIEYAFYAEQYSYYADDFVFHFLSEHPDYMTLENENDDVYQTFYDEIAETNIGRFYHVQLYLEQGEYESALELVNTIEPVNTIEENKKTCLLIYLASYSLGAELNNGHIEQLNEIALQLSIEGGEGVLWARAMLHIEVNEEEIGGEGGRFALQTVAEKQVNKAVKNIYPNPAKDYIIIEANDDLNMEILDLAGQIVRMQKIKKGNNNIFTGNLANGVYYYKILSRNGIVVNDKLIIIK